MGAWFARHGRELRTMCGASFIVTGSEEWTGYGTGSRPLNHSAVATLVADYRSQITQSLRSEVAASETFRRAMALSYFAKSCKMPAPGGRPVNRRKHSTGRRLTSLKGGNRGTKPHGYGRQWCYGDLSGEFSVRLGDIAGHRDNNAPCRVGCISVILVSLVTLKAKACISLPSATRSPDRV